MHLENHMLSKLMFRSGLPKPLLSKSYTNFTAQIEWKKKLVKWRKKLVESIAECQFAFYLSRESKRNKTSRVSNANDKHNPQEILWWY